MKNLITLKLALIICLSLQTIASAGTYTGGTGTEADPYLISTEADLHEMATQSADWVDGKHFRMTRDIVFSPGEIISTNFGGVFDGNGHKIFNLKLSGSYWYQGLFSKTLPTAHIKNLGMLNSVLTADYGSGALVAQNNGKITGCYSMGLLKFPTTNGSGEAEDLGGLVGYNSSTGTISHCYAMFTIVMYQAIGLDYMQSIYIGNFVGRNDGTITNCYSGGYMRLVKEFYPFVGGFAGWNNGTISNCYSTTSIGGSYNPVDACGFVGYNYGTITNCYSAGPLASGSVGFAASNFGTIEACFWNTDTSNTTVSGGGTPITNAQMKTRATFDNPTAGWDFENTWQIDEGLDFPYLHVGIGTDPPIQGDIDGDGEVNFKDLAIMAQNWLN